MQIIEPPISFFEISTTTTTKLASNVNIHLTQLKFNHTSKHSFAIKIYARLMIALQTIDTVHLILTGPNFRGLAKLLFCNN
jgi:hypothetical protein